MKIGNSNPIQLNQKPQFECDGDFMTDRGGRVQGTKPVFNLAVGLMDSGGK